MSGNKQEGKSGLYPAFPWDNNEGMTKRYYTAVEMSKHVREPSDFLTEKERKESYRLWAEKCYRMADALLEHE